MSEIRALADALHAVMMSADPFEASMLGVPGHDADVPDVSRAAVARRRDELVRLGARGAALQATTPQEQVTLAAVQHLVQAQIAQADAATIELTVSTMSDGPAMVLLVSSQTRPSSPTAARDYLERVRRTGGYVDGCIERLREGTAAGRTPVAALVSVVSSQLDGYLGTDPAAPGDPVSQVPAPAGWDGVDSWRAELEQAVRDVVRPAFARYRGLLDELLPVSRDDEHCGLTHLPGGDADYGRLVQVHTTLGVPPEQIHQIGLAAVESLVAQMTGLGARLGIDSFDGVLAGARAAAAAVDPLEAMARARSTVARAEELTPQWFPQPYPAPCSIEPMSDHLAAAGMPPMYFPPSPDGARPGTYLFNAVNPGAGSGWDLEATAYHEAVPGHHQQISRVLLQTDLPDLQRECIITAHAEGWGLYAEHLAEEMGLYSDDHQRLGALAMRTTRAARLVVDSGIHALGWSRTRAIDYMRDHVPLPADFLVSEVNRYVGLPGQALAYYTGYAEILRLRAHAEQTLADQFDVREFHGVLLGAGSVPLPALDTAVQAWLTELS